MNWTGSDIPPELQSCPQDTLERYVRARVLALAGSASVSRRLGASSETVRQAFADTLNEAGPLQCFEDAVAFSEGPDLQLSFGHDCQSLGCLEPGCALCTQNPNRRCCGNFSTKYLSGDVLKAKCGSSIRVEIVHRSTLEPVRGSVTEDIYLEMCILDGKAYAALQDAGREQYKEDVEGCIIALNNQGKELLVPGRGAAHNQDKWVIVQLARGQAYLPDLTVTGSSEALLSGQKPPFRLLARAMNSSNHTCASNIRFVVSEAFVVATPRVRTAAKAEIPHLDDHVSKLHAVGNMTQNKLQDISAAATAVGVYNIHVPYNTVTKVGQFKELVEVAEQDPQLCETLKKVLKLTRGWEVARDHAMIAVSTDNRMRIWYANAGASGASNSRDGGLLFKCHLGSVDLENPVGLLKKKEESGKQATTLETTLIQRLPASDKETIKKLQKQAALCWWRPGHPGWAIWPVETQHFLQDMAAPAGMLTAEHLITTTPTDMHGKAGLAQSEKPITRAAAQAAQAAEAQTSLSSGNASDNPLARQVPQVTRSSTPSEGGASLDGWMGAAAHHEQPASRAASREVRFPVQPSPQSSPVWANSAAAYSGTQRATTNSLGQHSGGRMDPPHGHMALPAWDGSTRMRQLQGNAVDRMSGDASGTLQQGLHAGMPRAWQDEVNSLGVQQMGAPPAHPGMADSRWSLPSRHDRHHPAQQAGGPYAGMRDYSSMAGPLQQPYGMAHTPSVSLNHMPTSGTIRKREHGHINNGRAAPMPGGESSPLPSPFGLPELQNMDLPPPLPLGHGANMRPMMEQRVSSGIEPAHAKRQQHLSPAELQQQLSHLVGRNLGAQEMSRIIPNFPDLLEDPNSTDLPSMTLTTSDLAGLMDAMLDPRLPQQHGADGSPQLPTAQASKLEGPSGRNGGPNDILNMDSYTYADLAEAVNVVHDGGGTLPHHQNASLSEPSSSYMLMDYLSARLAHPEGQYLVAARIASTSAPRDRHPGPTDTAVKDSSDRKELLNSRSGLDSMQSIEEALPNTEEVAVRGQPARLN